MPVVHLIRECQSASVNVKERAHVRAAFRVVGKERREAYGNGIRAEWRDERVHYLFARSRFHAPPLIVADAEEAFAHTHVETSWPCYLERQVMKRASSRLRIES